MKLPLRYLLPLAFGLLAAGFPALAAQTGSVQCEVNEERVWVYDSLANLNVEAKLDCGDTVEILGQVKGYVKIRTSGGRIGYIPKDALPNLPAANTSDANPAADQPVSLAEAAMRARRALEKPREEIAPPRPVTAAAVSATPASSPAPVPATTIPATQASYAAAAQPVRPISNRVRATPAATVSIPRNSSAHSLVAATAPTPAPPAATATAAPPAEIALTTAQDDTPGTRLAPENPTAAMPPTANIPPPPPAKTVQPVSAPANVSPANPVVERASAIPATQASPVAIVVPAVAAAPAEIAASSPAIPANIARPAPPTSNMRARHSNSSDTSMDEEEDADASLSAAEVSRQNCTAYFSAYGLTPNQFKWLMINRKKKFPGICPASLPSLVDYVIIFTHDVNFYNYTMPAPVRIDATGMSDWTPMRTVDTAFVSPSNADKNHREFVWVFHTRRGTFNPAQFSPRRRPQYAKNESNTFGSHAGDRTVEDALKFIEENGTNR